MLAGLADPRLTKVILAMHRDPATDWTLERMAGTAAMSRSAFAAGFKTVTGSTPAAYLSDWRLTRAISLMRSGKPLAVVAAACGFAGQSSLNKAFRQRYGCAPGAWLRQQREQKT
jgi:transcriptional regulator GlxA family with amidase domain